MSAVFAATGTHSYFCTPAPVTLYAVADFDHTTVYPGGGHWQPLQTHTAAHRAGCPAGQEPRRIEVDATVQARAVAAANTSVASFGMAADGGSMASWKRYASDATFSITDNRTPAVPLNVRYTAFRTGADRPALRSATPVLRAVPTDPDGGNPHGRFVVDLVAPAAPFVTPITGMPALYEKGGPPGGIWFLTDDTTTSGHEHDFLFDAPGALPARGSGICR